VKRLLREAEQAGDLGLGTAEGGKDDLADKLALILQSPVTRTEWRAF